MELQSPLNFTRKFFGDRAADIDDLSLIKSFADKKGLSGDLPVDEIVAQLETQSLTKLKQQNASSPLKATRRLFDEAGFGISDNQLALSYAKQKGLSPDTPLSDVFKEMEETSQIKLLENDRSLGGDSIFGANQIGSSVQFLNELNEDKTSAFGGEFLRKVDEELDLEGVAQFLRPDKGRKGVLNRIGQEVMSLDFFTQDIAKNFAQQQSELAARNPTRTKAFNRIEDELNQPEAISRFVAETQRFKDNPELFSEEEKQHLFNAAKLYETTGAFFNVEKTGLGEFLTALPKPIVGAVAKSINQVFGSVANFAGFDREITDGVLRDMNFTDQVLAENDPESKAAIFGNIAGSTIQTVMSVLSGTGPAGMFALYGLQGAGGNIEGYRALAREKGFEPEDNIEAIVGIGGMVIAGGLGAALTGGTVGTLPVVKSFVEGGERALFNSAARQGVFSGVTRDALFATGKEALKSVMKDRTTLKEGIKAYGKYAVSTGIVESIEEVSEEALNEALNWGVVEQFETDPAEFVKRLGMAGFGGFIGGAGLGPAVKSKIRKQINNASNNILGLSDIAPENPEEARANLAVLNEREAALKKRFDGEIPGIIQKDLADTRGKLQVVIEGAAEAETVFPKRDNPLLRFTAPLGDVASNPALKGTGFQEAAQANLDKEGIDISKSQLEAFTELATRLEQSDLPAEVVGQILGRVRMTRMETAKGRRNAITTHEVDENGKRSLNGVTFTNAANKQSAIDELFHILVDSAPPETHQDIVTGFNATYNARAADYNTDKTRDRIAAKVAKIVSGEEDLPDIDNAFTQTVRNIMSGEFSQVNLDLVGGISQNIQGQGKIADLDFMNQGLNDGSLRMVSVPGLEGKTTMQDEAGMVYEYVLNEDSEGETTGSIRPVGTNEKLPTIGVPNTRAIATFTGSGVRVEGAGTEENNNELRREVFQDVRTSRPVADSRALVVQPPEARFGTVQEGQGEEVNLNELRKNVFKEVGERLKKKNLIPTDPVSESEALVRTGIDPEDELGLLAAHIQRLSDQGQKIPLKLLTRLQELANPEIAGLLPPAQTQGIRTESGPIRDRVSIAAEDAIREGNARRAQEAFTAPVAPDQSIVRQEAAGVPALGPESFEGDRLIELASEAIRILESRGEPVPQALLDIITVDAEISDVEPATQALGNNNPQLQQAVTGPTSYVEFLEATNQLPEQFAAELRDRLAGRKREQALLPEASDDRPSISSEDASRIKAKIQKNKAQIRSIRKAIEAVPDIGQIDESSELEGLQQNLGAIQNELAIAENVEASLPVLADLDPRIVENLDVELIPVVEALISGEGIGGVSAIGETDVATGFPLMEVTEEMADELATAGVAVTGTVQLGDTPPTQTLPNIVSFNPAALAVANQTTPQSEARVADADAAFNDALVDSERVKFVTLEDETGQETTRYPTKQSARNALEARFEGETEDTPGQGNQDILAIGSREFTLTPGTESSQEILTAGFGQRTQQVGAILANLEDGSAKTSLLKAAKAVKKQLVNQAKGSALFTDAKLSKALTDLDTVIAEVNPGVDLQAFAQTTQATGNTRAEFENLVAYAEDSDITFTESIDILNDSVQYTVGNKIVAEVRGENEIVIQPNAFDIIDDSFVENEVLNSEESQTEEGDDVSEAKLDKLESAARKVADKRRKKFSPKAEVEVQEVPDVAPVDVNDSGVKDKLRRMRARIKRQRFNRLDNTGLAEFRGKTAASVDTFIEKAEELGATQVNRSKVDNEEGKAEHVVEVQFHPEIANRIFKDKVNVTVNDDAIFTVAAAHRIPRNFEGEVANNSEIKQPTFSENVPSKIKAATTDLIKGLKIRTNLMVATIDDIMAMGHQSGSDITSVLIRNAQERVTLSRAKGNILGGTSVHASRGDESVAIILTDGTDDFRTTETLTHEFGHIVARELLSRDEHNDAFQDLSDSHNEFIEKSQDLTVAEFIKQQRLPGQAFTQLLHADVMNTMTMTQMRNDPQLNQFYQYITSFDEWFADQTARWIVSPKKPEVTKATGGYFKALEKRLRSLYDRLFNRKFFAPDTTFESWMNAHALSLHEGNVNTVIPSDGSRSEGHSIVQEDSMPLENVSSWMDQTEVDARNTNQFEFSVNGEIALLRDELSNWSGIERGVLSGKSIASTFDTQIEVDKARRYEQLYTASIALRNRPAPTNVPLDVIASYSTSAGLFPDTWSERMDDWYQSFVDSEFNQVRRRLISPVITRVQKTADNNKELKSVQTLVDKIFASAGRRSGEVPYVDRVQQEMTQRLDGISGVVAPIFESFGYTGSAPQRVVQGFFKGKKINEVVKQVYLGVRNKEWLTQAQRDTEYNGVKLETMIDKMRVEMDSLRKYGVSKGLLTEDDFITYKTPDGQEHYVPRIYNSDTVRANFEHFKVQIIERNLRRVYRQDLYIDFLEQTDPDRVARMTDQQLHDIVVPNDFENFDGKLSPEHETNVVEIAENVAANIAFGRTSTFAKEFNPENFGGHENFVKIADKFGTRVPDRLKRRKIFFVPDEEFLGRTPVNGKEINFLETNIIEVMGRSVEQLVKRGEYMDIFDGGKVFATAYQDIRDKKRAAELQGDSKTARRMDHDLEAIDAVYESVAEIVDLNPTRSAQNGPMRDMLSSFSRAATVSVMGLSTILAVVEFGNIPLRVGLVPGMKAVIGKSLEIGLKKLVKWPGAAFGKGEHYTDILEDELTTMGYLHRVTEDFSARVRTDNPFDSERGSATGPLLEGQRKGETLGEKGTRVARNAASAFEFMEDMFYRATMLEQMTRLSQVVAAHAANEMIVDIITTSDSGTLSSAQNRELKRLGFVDSDGNLSMEQFNEYKAFHAGLRAARSQGKEAMAIFAKENAAMFQGAHFRLTTRLVNQMIARPNVVTRPRWGNSKTPLKRMAYRLRSFTHGYRELAARYYTDEFLNVKNEEGVFGIAHLLARFLPLLVMSMMGIVARAEISAYIHEASGNTSQAKRIRTLQADKGAADFMIEAFDKTGMTLQGSEVLGGVQGLKYGSSIFAVLGGVTASKLERSTEALMQSAISGDPAFIWNNMVDFSPGANTGAWDGLKLDPQSTRKKTKSDADHFGMLNGSDAKWW